MPLGLQPDFRAWLKDSRFRRHDFSRDDVRGGSFGGRTSARQSIDAVPVVFVHGNGDSALGSGGRYFNGWQVPLQDFLPQGYGPELLYGTTWGPADPKLGLLQSHDRTRVGQVRAFIESVLEYTGAPRVHVVAHSMGVTLTRKALQGGRLVDGRGPVDLGPSLRERVDAFIGIAGANLGLNAARSNPLVRVWNPLNGFFPGLPTPLGVVGRSRFLVDINRRQGEARRVYSIWSRADAIVDVSVGGAPSGRIPGQRSEVVFDDLDHFQIKDRTGPVVLQLIRGERDG